MSAPFGRRGRTVESTPQLFEALAPASHGIADIARKARRDGRFAGALFISGALFVRHRR